ncbi:MAG: Gfo/Idh/MocA family oxidoreductase, partial [Lentisphaerae bacterium]|nr:Gfo/Idh/MocA family oxidoreductase [Lentisphaerota bacterium]
MKKIKIAVAGLGRIGWHFHCKVIAESRDFELVAVADPDAERRAEAEGIYGCASSADYDAMLDAGGLDAVVVATPTHFHKAHSLAALRKGMHVYLEKPMAMDLAEARAIARAAKKAGRVLSVYQPHRAHACLQHVLRIIRSGKIGEVYHVRRGMFNFARRNDWQSLRKFGGGMLNNYGAHCLDQVLFITGYDVKRITCNLRRVASMGDAEDVVKIFYETRGGVVGEVDINQACVLRPYEFEVLGTRGGIVVSNQEITVRWFSPRGLKAKELDPSLASANRRYPSDSIEVKEETVPVNPRYGVDVYKDLARAIRTGATPLVDPAETLQVMKVMQRCREDAGKI